MRRLIFATLGLVLTGLIVYAIGLGIYAVSSTAPELHSQPANATEARATLAQLGVSDLYPFESRFVDVPHGRMHYVDEGRGPTLLCLHGNPTWSFLYRDFVKGLSDTARVVAPDLIGFGLSSKPEDAKGYTIEGHIEDVSALIESRDLRDITLVLQDWGGPIGVGVAMKYPDRIRAIVAMNTIAYELDSSAGIPAPLRMLQRPVIGDVLVRGLGVFSKVIVPASLSDRGRHEGRVVDAYVKVQGNWQERAGTVAFPRSIPTRPDHPVVELLREEDRFLRAFRGRVLLIWGLRDPVFGPQLDAWRERFPDAEVLELSDAGHYLQEDAADRIVPRIREFLGN